MERCIEREWLDELRPEEPRAIQSRRDLKRINAWMGNAQILAREITFARLQQQRELRILELGAGDGTFMLRLARRLQSRPASAEASLLDQQSIVSNETRRGFRELDWTVKTLHADVFDWLGQSAIYPVDIIVANLFLHHFHERDLKLLLHGAARRTNLFVACEPRRSALALAATRFLPLIGCNEVSRHDALLSVRAGFIGTEISSLWPKSGAWELREKPAGLFSHLFLARKRTAVPDDSGGETREHGDEV
jgi:Methyltransferase domain